MENKEIIGGSIAFFDGIDGFVPHDKDVNWFLPYDLGDYMCKAFVKGKDVFLWNKEATISALKNNEIKWYHIFPFLIKEFIDELGLTFEDIKPLLKYKYNFNGKNKYYYYIMDAYEKNNGMFLTEEQRMEAYQAYTEFRKNIRKPKKSTNI